MENTSEKNTVATIIMAAGRGSRMKGYGGNKTLLPLKPAQSIFEGDAPILLHLMQQLPEGPKAIIVNHCKDDVMAVTQHSGVSYCQQPALNGTGGAIIAAGDFIADHLASKWIITMGDVPFVKKETYDGLVHQLETHDMVVLGFKPKDKKQYGVLEIADDRVHKITEWKYWKDYAQDYQETLTVCNSGIYAITKKALMTYLPILADNPQVVHKEIDGKMTAIQEFFFTDLIEYMVKDGQSVGYVVTENELETMGIDDVDALEKAHEIYNRGLL